MGCDTPRYVRRLEYGNLSVLYSKSEISDGAMIVVKFRFDIATIQQNYGHE